MLHIRSASIGRFKSFKKADLLFNNGFNCIVGPNGSGKSNIIDALLFCLGETSLRRLRVDRLQYLIREASARGSGPGHKAFVRLELDGDAHVELSKWVRADGKTLYKLNGKRMTRQEVLEVLRSHGVHVDETSTIAQGEINKIIEANAKQRREFIDVAAGIQEFDAKKTEAMTELDKVAARMAAAQAMLDERLVFLNELAKEKAAAESYAQLTKRRASLQYSVLAGRKKAAELAGASYVKEIGALDASKAEISARLKELSGKTQKLEGERKELLQLLAEHSNAADSTGKKFAEIGNELSALDVRIGNWQGSSKKLGEEMAAVRSELDSMQERIEANSGSLLEHKRRLAELEAEAKKLGARSAPVREDIGRRVRELDGTVMDIEKALAAKREAAAGLQARAALLGAKADAMGKELRELNDRLAGEMAQAEEAKAKAASALAAKQKLSKEAQEASGESERLRSELSAIDSELIGLKEQRAMSRPREQAVQGRLRDAFGKSKGFYGAVSELCSYDDKYAEAIEAAAGSRFGYFVVDSVDAAKDMISYLRVNNLGRATFIPLRELRAEPEDGVKGLQLVSDLLDYDDRFDGVFSYVFNNTYLVESIDAAKRAGIGAHRWVTPQGELVERSGILSGGSRSRPSSLGSIERRIRELEEKKGRLFSRAKEMDSSLFTLRSGAAEAEMQSASYSALADEHGSAHKVLAAKLEALRAELDAAAGERTRVAKELAAAQDAIAAASRELDGFRKERTDAYEESMRESAELAGNGMGKAERERLERANAEMREASMKVAGLQKENDMLAASMAQKGRELEAKAKALEEAKAGLERDAKRKEELLVLQREAEAKMLGSSKRSKQALEKQDAISRELEALASKAATAEALAGEQEKKSSELLVKQGQNSTRLNDLTAELAAYVSSDCSIVEGDPEQLEKEAALVAAKVEALGNVNLKAPGAYEEKARSVREAKEKLDTLESERRAVLAMMEEIEAKKMNAFMTTFNEVNKNFSRLYNYIYPGKATLALEDPKSPLESGMTISIEDDNFVGRQRGMSGGQKSLLSMMLLFSIHMCKPSSIYLFDEIDTALDKENSKRLSQLIKQMSSNAQFVVVSHNDTLIVSADAAIGVAKSAGDSKVYGIEVTDVSRAGNAGKQ